MFRETLRTIKEKAVGFIDTAKEPQSSGDAIIEWQGHQIPIPPLDMSDPELFHRRDLLENAFKFVSFNEIAGDYLEFGCASARTFRMAYDLISHYGLETRLWAFDSFQGLPVARDARDAHPKWTPGNYPTAAELFTTILDRHGVPSAKYEVIQGFYEDTIGPNSTGSEEYSKNVAIANIDCDMHSSTADVLHFLEPRMKAGMIIYFDDYYCYADGQKSGERIAMLEFLEKNPQWRFEHFKTVGWHGRAFVVEDA